MNIQLSTDRSSELFTLSRGMIRAQLRNLKLRYRFKLRKVDLNVLADELAVVLAQMQAAGGQIIDFPQSPDFSDELQLILDPSAQKRRN